MDKKTKLQKEAVSILKENKRVVLQWCTGLGKSKVAIDSINRLTKENKDLKILLVVAETAHKSNWEKEFKKWKLKPCNIIVECYASLRKYTDTTWDFIIFDEAHHLGSNLRIEAILTMKAEYILMLSATFPVMLLGLVNEAFGNFVILKVTLKEAIEQKLLPKPKIFLIPLTLNSTDTSYTITEEWGNKDIRQLYKCSFNQRWEYLSNRSKYPNVTLEISCTQLQKYEYLTNQFEYWRSRFLRARQEFAKNKWLQAGSKRKRFLGECKIKEVYSLLPKLHKKRFICFCSSIEQAKLLGGKNAIHSQRDDTLNVIEAFNNKKINNLFAVGMLQEGQNLTDIEAGIIVQLDGQERSFVQKFGRTLRADSPLQFIFYYKGTRDEEYLKSIVEGIDEDYITEVNNIDNLEI